MRPDAVPETIFVPAFTDFPDATRDLENHWYDTDHVPQRLTVPGFSWAVRYERAAVEVSTLPQSPLRYINAYAVSMPAVLTSLAYEASVTHVTPRTALEQFAPTPPALRDVWSVASAPTAWPAPHNDAAAPHTVWVVAYDAAEPAMLCAALDDEVAPAILDTAGVTGMRRLTRLDTLPATRTVAVPSHALVIGIASPEAVTRPDVLAALAAGNDALGRAGEPAPLWSGVYARRPRPWMTL